MDSKFEVRNSSNASVECARPGHSNVQKHQGLGMIPVRRPSGKLAAPEDGRTPPKTETLQLARFYQPGLDLARQGSWGALNW